MKLPELLTYFAKQLDHEKEAAVTHGYDVPLESITARRTATAGTLHLYALDIPEERVFLEDIPLTVFPPEDSDSTEGYCLQRQHKEVLIQTYDSLGQTSADNTVIPDTSGFFETAGGRLLDMSAKPESYSLGPAERLAPWLDPDQTSDQAKSRVPAPASVLTTVWHEQKEVRWQRLGALIVDLLRQNKRLLLLGPHHQCVDELTGFLAKTLHAAALPFKSLLSCYETPILQHAYGFPLQEFGFETQMHGFYAKSRANKDVLRKQYERFRELTPILAYKCQKQRDLNEVKLLEWRLLSDLSDFQGKIYTLDKTVAQYESLPIWKRLAMQAAGKNVESLGEYRQIYEQKVRDLLQEIEIAQARIKELTPEAAIPKDMRPEYEELKEEITRLGGTKKIRELLAAGEGTNRQAFIQNKRLVATTPGRILIDPLFQRVRFDVLIADDAPQIPAPFLLGAAGLIRERIIISGNTQDLSACAAQFGAPWRQYYLPESARPHVTPSSVA